MLRFRQRFPDEPRGSVDEPFDREIKFRIEGELLAHESDSFSLSCVTYQPPSFSPPSLKHTKWGTPLSRAAPLRVRARGVLRFGRYHPERQLPGATVGRCPPGWAERRNRAGSGSLSGARSA